MGGNSYLNYDYYYSMPSSHIIHLSPGIYLSFNLLYTSHIQGTSLEYYYLPTKHDRTPYIRILLSQMPRLLVLFSKDKKIWGVPPKVV